MPAKDPAKADIENRFNSHELTEEGAAQCDAVRADLRRLAHKMQKSLPDGREKSLVLTHLEEAMFWANAAIARAGQSGEAAPATPAPSGPTSTRPVKKSTRRTTSSSRKVTRRRRSEPPI